LRAGVAQVVQVRFELTDRRSVAICRGGPSPQNLGSRFGEPGEPLFEDARITGGGPAKMLDLRLQVRETFLKFAVRLHLHLVRRMLHKSGDRSNSDPVVISMAPCGFRARAHFGR
jgi:hypothetical protein